MERARKQKEAPKYLEHFVDQQEEARKKNPIMTQIMERVEREELK